MNIICHRPAPDLAAWVEWLWYRDQFYGERSGSVRGPFGHEWLLGHEIEKVSPEEMQRRYNSLLK
jgi:hypothetical protein